MDDSTRITKTSKASELEHPYCNKTPYEIELDEQFRLLDKIRDAESISDQQATRRYYKSLAESKKRLEELERDINGIHGCASRIGSVTYFDYCKKWFKRCARLSAYRDAWRHSHNL